MHEKTDKNHTKIQEKILKGSCPFETNDLPANEKKNSGGGWATDKNKGCLSVGIESRSSYSERTSSL